MKNQHLRCVNVRRLPVYAPAYTVFIVITWTEAKRLENLRVHKVDFASLAELFDGDLLTVEDTRDAYGELRFLRLGEINHIILMVVWTPRGTCDDIAHVIPARKAKKHEAQAWYQRYARRPQG